MQPRNDVLPAIASSPRSYSGVVWRNRHIVVALRCGEEFFQRLPALPNLLYRGQMHVEKVKQGEFSSHVWSVVVSAIKQADQIRVTSKGGG